MPKKKKISFRSCFLRASFVIVFFAFQNGKVFAQPPAGKAGSHPLYVSGAEPDTPASFFDSNKTASFSQSAPALNARPSTSSPEKPSYILTLSSPKRSPISGIPYEKIPHTDSRFAGSSGLSAAEKNKWRRKKGWFNHALYELDKFFNQPVPEQYSTGTLYELFAPSDQGEWTIEPYFISTVPNGQFNGRGKQVPDSPGAYSFSQQWYLQAGITDRLNVNIMPGYIYNWGGGSPSGSVEMQDLPFDLLYRVTGDDKSPLVTVYLGGQAPTGPYDQLQNPNNGTGTGAWSFNFGVSSMASFPFLGHALITDIWAQANQTTGDVRVRGVSTYGTDENFNGWAIPSQFGSAGAGFEFGVTKKFMLDLELIGYWNAPVRMKGWESGQWQSYQESGWTDVFQVGPGMEYSFNEHWGVVAEVMIPVAGVNESADLSPTAAIVCSY